MRYTAPVLILFLCALPLMSHAAPKEKTGTVTVDVRLTAPPDAKHVRLWIPYPLSDENQDVSAVQITGNHAYAAVGTEPKGGAGVLYAEWRGPAAERKLTYSFRITRREVDRTPFPKKEVAYSPDEFGAYLESSPSLPLSPKVVSTAKTITKGRKTVLAKARAIYDWIVENMHRDPNVKGCGYGDVERLLETKGGKCADIHSVFVALARAAGVPSREVFGIRLPKTPQGDITRWQHCWAEFYLPGHGWVVVDPADVRKYILEQKCDLEAARPVREYYFGSVDENRAAYGTGRDIILNPAQAARPLNYFMYPYAEADGKPLSEDLYGFDIGYTITFAEHEARSGTLTERAP